MKRCGVGAATGQVLKDQVIDMAGGHSGAYQSAYIAEGLSGEYTGGL